MGIVDLIAQWSLSDSEEDDTSAHTPPDNLSFDDLVKFSEVQLNRRDAWDGRAYLQAYDIATGHTEDQLQAFHMAPMLKRMGMNVRCSHSNLHSVLNEVIEHAWLQKVDFETLKQYLGDHPGLVEICSPRKFRQLLGDLVGCEVALGDWQQFTSEEQRLVLYVSFYGIPAPDKVHREQSLSCILRKL